MQRVSAMLHQFSYSFSISCIIACLYLYLQKTDPQGDKNIIKFEGDHNSPRPQFYFDSISIFFNNVLQPPEDEGGSRYFDLSQDYFSGVNCCFAFLFSHPLNKLDLLLLTNRNGCPDVNTTFVIS